MILLLLLKGGIPPPSGYRVSNIPDLLLGTGLHVLVWDGSVVRHRVTTEANALTIDSGLLRQINTTTETLQS